MLSIAQAVHPESQGSTPGQRSALPRSWSPSPERKNAAKRQKTSESDNCASTEDNYSFKKITEFNYNNPEITLTVIPKNLSVSRKQEDKMVAEEYVNTLPENVPPVVMSFFEKSNEIQLTKVDSKPCVRFIKQVDSNEQYDKDSESVESTESTDVIYNRKELNEVTIEPIAAKIAKAEKLLQKKEPNPIIESLGLLPTNKQSQPQIVEEPFETKIEEIPTDNFITDEPEIEAITCLKSNGSIFDEEPENQPALALVQYDPFMNVGMFCDEFYIADDKPHYATGFPNPPGENRCWINSMLQVFFALPIMEELQHLHALKKSKLISLLFDIHTCWAKSSTDTNQFDQTFRAFKDETIVLDKFYPSKIQQDVSEFYMNLVNHMKGEYKSLISQESKHEIENIPNNDQDALRRMQNNCQDFNKRLPLADISDSPRKLRNHQQSNSSQQDKTDLSSKISSNLFDEHFLLDMTENYVCEGCKKQRQRKADNLVLLIDLPHENENNPVPLADIINKSYALEHRSMSCESCNHDTHSMQVKLKEIPKLLTIQIKRYDMAPEGVTKNVTLIDVPRVLELDSLIIYNSEEFAECPTYEAVGIISHIGDNVDSGHYISFVRHESNWFYYDDSNVKILTEEEVFKLIQNNAYVVFYKVADLDQEIIEESLDIKDVKECDDC
ncbi:hypothetical protein TKK_0016733 [Trichogramma kaykai]|uniref:ubiquitinyl hydrolase 1 n=1 Tax=Trichogramma kaykai TaxID=54128 RepID=A0ABD2W3A7_9HYME